jgi:hypothetical protein
LVSLFPENYAITDSRLKSDLSDINTKLLFLACADGNYERAKMFLDSGAKVQDDEGLLVATAAFSQCDNETKYKLVKLLLARGGNPNHKSHFGAALIASYRSGSVKLIRLLLHRGAHIHHLQRRESPGVDGGRRLPQGRLPHDREPAGDRPRPAQDQR